MSGTGKGRKLREGCFKMAPATPRSNRRRTPSRQLATVGGKAGREAGGGKAGGEGLEGERLEGERLEGEGLEREGLEGKGLEGEGKAGEEDAGGEAGGETGGEGLERRVQGGSEEGGGPSRTVPHMRSPSRTRERRPAHKGKQPTRA